MVAHSKPSYKGITSFSFNYADFPFLSSKSSAFNSYNFLQSSKLSNNSIFSNFAPNSFAESVLKSNHHLFPLETTSTQNSSFLPSAHKVIVGSAPVKNASFFFLIQMIYFLISRAYVATYMKNCNPKYNLGIDRSKLYISPVSFKTAIPVSVSNFRIPPTLSISSDAIIQKPSFESYSFYSSFFKNSTSKRPFVIYKIIKPQDTYYSQISHLSFANRPQ